MKPEIAVSDRYGEVFFAVPDPFFEGPDVMHRSDDFGATSEIVQFSNGDTVFTGWQTFHQRSGTLVHAYGQYQVCLSTDYGLTIDRTLTTPNLSPPFGSAIVQQSDDIVFAIYRADWSFDTLQTIYDGEFNVPPHRPWHMDHCQGWNAGQAFMFSGSNDTTYTYVTNDSSNNYELLSSGTGITFGNPEHPSGYFFPGSEPGEFYAMSCCIQGNLALYFSSDYGESWHFKHILSEYPLMVGSICLYPAWGSGSIFLHWQVFTSYFVIGYSEDYGENFDFFEYHRNPNSVDEPSLQKSEEIKITFEVYPNPTNGWLNFKTTNTNFPVILTDILGRNLQTFNTNELKSSATLSISLFRFPTGTYYLGQGNAHAMKIHLIR